MNEAMIKNFNQCQVGDLIVFSDDDLGLVIKTDKNNTRVFLFVCRVEKNGFINLYGKPNIWLVDYVYRNGKTIYVKKGYIEKKLET